jgi:hypothetical protein
MNERILSPQLLKLVQQAGPGYSLANPEWVKKFAELIVQECLMKAIGAKIRGESIDTLIQNIKEDFGVKE